jgi:hypothetical protein
VSLPFAVPASIRVTLEDLPGEVPGLSAADADDEDSFANL